METPLACHPCLLSVSLLLLVAVKDSKFSRYGWHLPEGLHISYQHFGSLRYCCKSFCIFAPSSLCPAKGIWTMAPHWRSPSITSPAWLRSSHSHLIYIKWDKGIRVHGEQSALISFHLACSHKTSFSVELFLASIKMYGLPNMFKWLFGPRHYQKKANKICPIYLNSDGRELGGDGSL